LLRSVRAQPPLELFLQVLRSVGTELLDACDGATGTFAIEDAQILDERM
jgi:hypothetical protein